MDYKVKKVRILLLTLTLFSLILTGKIIPDKTNPIIITKPNSVAEASILRLSFQLPTTTKGVHYKQFIALKFPYSDSTVTNLGTSNFKFNLASAAKCYLYKGTTPINVVWTASPTGEENICYCQIIDEDNLVVPLDGVSSYQLQIELPNLTQKPAAIFWRNFDLYTTTSNTMKGLKIDICNSFGSGAIFADYKLSTNKLVNLETISKITAGLDDLSKNYQYSTFDVRLKIKVYGVIRGADAFFNFIYPDYNLVAVLPNAYVSTDIDANTPLN